ncbi:lipoprotein [Spiroplasma taiwanense]|uniref:Uncharacterized protein n=1 Tax=Spiroplasma taiwanense CT-1 TaxID=1276220 RepID=S5MCC8_9MOLU|nr:lipoprotein [Spiroplasma taiwanense]AGR41393.1 hypothetical protein STAIW_v1c08050 [Spiroplasma taiwanense CT-1]
MKKLLIIISSIGLITSSSLTVVSCSNWNDYSNLFDKDGSDENDGEFILDGPDEIINNVKSVLNSTVIADVKIKEENNLKILSRNIANHLVAIDDLISYLKKQVNIKDDNFKIEISNDNTFKLPELYGIGSDGITFDQNANVNLGKAKLDLFYLNKKLYTQEFNWTVPEYDVVEKVINSLHTNSFTNPDSLLAKKVDLILFDWADMGVPGIKITLGTIYQLIQLLNIKSVTNFSLRAGGMDDILSLIGPLLQPIKNLVNQDVNQLAQANPDEQNGKQIYENFDRDFRNNLQDLFSAFGNLLRSLGIKDEITIAGNEQKPDFTFKVSEFLNVNLFDLIDLDLSSINGEQEFGSGVAQGKMFIDLKIGSKGVQNKVAIGDILANVAPNIVLMFSKFLNPDTYNTTKGGSHNFLYLFLKELFTQMDDRLFTINSKNNKNHHSADSSGSTMGIDSLLFNLLLDYNKNNRVDEKLNLSIKLNLDIELKVLGITVKKTMFKNATLYELLDKIVISPGQIVLKIFNNLFNLGEKGYLELDTLFLGPNLNMIFFTNDSIKISAILDDMDLSSIERTAIDALMPLFQDTVTTTLNEQINKMLPEMSMQMIINLIPDSLIKGLGVEEKYLNNSKVIIEKAQFVFQFKKIGQNAIWENMVSSISSDVIARYDSLRLHIQNMQLRVIFESEKNGKFEYLTKDNLSINIVFSDDDTK